MNIMASINRYFINRQSARALSQMGPCQLDDLGLNRGDIFDSRNMGSGSRLEFLIERKHQRLSKNSC